MMHRRELFKTTESLVAVFGVARESARAADAGDAAPFIVDTNVGLFQWPFRRLPLDRMEKLVSKLQSLGVAQAWAGSFEGILHCFERSFPNAPFPSDQRMASTKPVMCCRNASRRVQ